MDPPPDGHGPDGAGDRPFGGGSVRVRTQCSPPEVLLRVQDPAAWWIDASFPWKGFRGYAFPPISLIPRVLRKIREDQAWVVLIAPRWPRRNWFLDLIGLLAGSPRTLPPSPGLDSAADIAGPTSPAECPALDCVAIIRKAGTQAGLSDRVAAIIASSRRESTCESYNSRLAGFFQWCNSHGVDPCTASISQIANFLITLFDKGRLISTIRGYRSAIAAIHKGFDDGTCVSTAPCLGNLVRALFLKRLPARKLLPSWSLPAVLEALAKPPFEPLAEVSLRDLVAIASGQRRSALHALSTAPGHVRWSARACVSFPIHCT